MAPLTDAEDWEGWELSVSPMARSTIARERGPGNFRRGSLRNEENGPKNRTDENGVGRNRSDYPPRVSRVSLRLFITQVKIGTSRLV